MSDQERKGEHDAAQAAILRTLLAEAHRKLAICQEAVSTLEQMLADAGVELPRGRPLVDVLQDYQEDET